MIFQTIRGFCRNENSISSDVWKRLENFQVLDSRLPRSALYLQQQQQQQMQMQMQQLQQQQLQASNDIAQPTGKYFFAFSFLYFAFSLIICIFFSLFCIFFLLILHFLY